jgi:hypothetical protein
LKVAIGIFVRIAVGTVTDKIIVAGVNIGSIRRVESSTQNVRQEAHVSMKVVVRQVNDVVIVDLSGQIKLGEGSSVLRDTVKDLLGKGQKKILLNPQSGKHQLHRQLGNR